MKLDTVYPTPISKKNNPQIVIEYPKECSRYGSRIGSKNVQVNNGSIIASTANKLNQLLRISQ